MAPRLELVEITMEEYYLAVEVGAGRQLRAIFSDRKDRHGAHLRKRGGFDIHILGALGEFVVTKLLRVEWIGLYGFGFQDVAGYQVKTTESPIGHLWAHKENPEEDIHILVTPSTLGPLKWCVRGWMTVKDIRAKGVYPFPPGVEDTKGYREAHWIHWSKLNPIQELMNKELPNGS